MPETPSLDAPKVIYHRTASYSVSLLWHLSTTPIPRSVLPPFLPQVAIEFLFLKLPVHLIMRLTHPSAKQLPTLNPGLVSRPLHPFLKVLRTMPARVQP